MAISRPVLLALLGALLFGATALAVQNARTGSDSDATPAAVQTDPAPTGTQPSANSTPQQTLDQAFDLGSVQSGKFALRLRLAQRNEFFRVSLAGAFQKGAQGDLPDFETHGRLADEKQAATVGFRSTGDKAYFTRGETGWRVPPEIWGPVSDGVAKRNATGGVLPIHPATWVSKVESKGTATVDGVQTDHVSATVDPKAIAKDLAQVAKANGIDALRNPGKVSGAVKRAQLDVWVGADDHIVRRAVAVAGFAGNARMAVDLRLTDVNKPQQVDAPEHVRAGAPGGFLGAIANGLVRGASGGTSLDAYTSPNPGRAARAVRKHKKVVILFRNPRGLDDKAMSPVLRDVNRRTQALVLSDDVAAVDRYGKLVEDLGVSQTPSIVIIDRKGNARLIEGYVDSNTLTQAVSDAR
jgi:hypothetical protein